MFCDWRGLEHGTFLHKQHLSCLQWHVPSLPLWQVSRLMTCTIITTLRAGLPAHDMYHHYTTLAGLPAHDMYHNYTILAGLPAHDTYRISPCISRGIYPRTKYYIDNSSYTRVTPSGKKLYRKQVEFESASATWLGAVVSDNAWIDEYSIAPLIYHLYTNPFLCYSWDIILLMHFICILVNFHVV